MSAIPTEAAQLPHRLAALRLLAGAVNGGLILSHKEAGFLGHVCIADQLTDKQVNWLGVLLDKAHVAPGNSGVVA